MKKLTFILSVVALFFNGSLNAQCWTKIVAGETFYAGIKEDGTLWQWGEQLGGGPTFSTPVQIGTATHWEDLSAGASHLIVATNTGVLWALGNNSESQIGNQSTIHRQLPVRVQILPVNNPFVSIAGATNGSHSLAVTSSGQLWAWGSNLGGFLVPGSNDAIGLPVRIGTDSDWKMVSAGSMHSIALKQDGTLWAWGANELGQLGTGYTTSIFTPTHIDVGNTYKSIASGAYFNLAIRSDDALVSWGYNNYGQLGNGTTTSVLTPTVIDSGSWKNVFAGGVNAGAVKSTDELYTWGINNNGQLGAAVSGFASTPQLVNQNIGTSPTNLRVGATNTYTTVVLKDDNSLSVVGSGNSSFTSMPCTPIPVANPSGSMLFPNPSTDFFNVSVPDNGTINQVNLYDVSGKLVLQTNKAQVAVQDLAIGMYNVEVITSNQVMRNKFVKN